MEEGIDADDAKAKQSHASSIVLMALDFILAPVLYAALAIATAILAELMSIYAWFVAVPLCLFCILAEKWNTWLKGRKQD